MKLGNTREEMQRNYSEIKKKAIRLGVIFAVIGVIASFGLFSQFNGVDPNEFAPGQYRLIKVGIILYPLIMYFEGQVCYLAFRRIGDWCAAIAPDDEGFFSAILGIVAFPIMFSVGQFFGIYDLIKLYIDAGRYGLKISK